jgi:ferrous iron transport protein A
MSGHCCKKRRKKNCSCCMLNDLKSGRRARIQRHHATGAVRQRLLNLGFIPNAEVDVIRRAPFGDPIQCRVANCCVTLPCSEAGTD